ncbi:MAG TPA: hypothetical protein VFU84_07235, partial [Gaiellaceae bacterium]|nr:hypothetical protein [Gaiellaceae bacterium]
DADLVLVEGLHHDEAVARTEQELGARVPIVSATKESLRARLQPLVASASERKRIGAESRAYVEQVHDSERVADRLLALYARLPRKTGIR